MSTDYSNNLIYGKNKLLNIVSIEANDETVELYLEDKVGNIHVEFHDNVYWVLTPKPLNKNFIKLNGDLHYKYARTFRDKIEFFKYCQYLKAQGEDFYKVSDPKEAIMLRDGYTYFKGKEVKEVSLLSFDIETTGLNHNEESKVLLISTTYRNAKGGITKKLFAYDEYASQGEMLNAFCEFVRYWNPSLIIGHNILSFDLPYLQFIADKENVTLDLGRDDSAIKFDNYESKFRKDGSQFYHYKKAKIYGREIIDTLFLAIKYDATARNFESYGLKNIIKQLKLEKKDRVYYDASKIRTNYQIAEEWVLIKQYCVDDSDESVQLFDLMAPPFFYSTQSIPKSFQSIIEGATGSQINAIMTRAYLQDKHSIPKATEAAHYEGAISIGNVGVYRNVWKVDVASLYPSIMIEYKVGDPLKDPKGYFQELVLTFTNERLKNKKLAKTSKYYDDLQASQKIFINSAYGFLGTAGLNFNAPDQAAFVTRKGREILTAAMEWAENTGFQLVNADTDSISITNGNELDEDSRSPLLFMLNTKFPKQIKWEDDGYYETVIVLKAKNYILKKKGEKPKYKGSAIKATLKEPRLKDFIKEIIREIGTGREDYLTVYNKYVKEINNITDITGWCTKKTITEAIETSERANESKVRDAMGDNSDYRSGDKIYTYFLPGGKLSLRENFNGEYCKGTLLKKLYKTVEIFDSVLDIDQFLNYNLKRNQKLLETLLKGEV